MNKNILIFLLAAMVSVGSWAQSEDKTGKDAEQLFENIFPLGIDLGIQYANLKEEWDRGNFNFDQNDLWIPELGFTYNFYQKNNFNFKAGIKTRFFKYKSFLPLNSDKYNTLESTELIRMRKNEYSLNLPITAEYIRSLSDKSWLAIHAGYELQYHTNSPVKVISERQVLPDGLIKLRESSFENDFSHGINLGAGIYHRIGQKLMKFELNYHFQFSKRSIHQELQATGLPDHSDVWAFNSWNGNHLDAKLTFYLFNKNSK